MFKVGDKVKFSGCPFDEQIAGEAMRYANMKDKVQTVTEVRDTSKVHGTTGQWIKTDLNPEWIDKFWFKAI